MGFRPEPTVYKITFEGTMLDGMFVRIGCCTVGEFNRMAKGFPGEGDANTLLFELFLKYLVEWNIERQNAQSGEWEDVPHTLEAINGLKSNVMSLICASWQRAMVNISPNSQQPSSDGEISEEYELGLASSSESQPS